jgi:hypothetical protein
MASSARGNDKNAQNFIEKTKKNPSASVKKALYPLPSHRIMQHASVMIFIAMAVMRPRAC